jgi:hypothetical protein
VHSTDYSLVILSLWLESASAKPSYLDVNAPLRNSCEFLMQLRFGYGNLTLLPMNPPRGLPCCAANFDKYGAAASGRGTADHL